ncbi:MAG: hypothetical protein LBL83_03005 [Clostridiales bacterium]|nr:hypothetical protein [Clostridiales bacterium]
MPGTAAIARLRHIFAIVAFCGIIGGFFALNRIVRPPEISASERRPLATMPELSASGALSADFMGEFEDFAADSFAFRDALRSVRALAAFGLFMQTDKGGLYYGESGAGKIEKLDEASVAQAAQKIAATADGIAALGRDISMYYSFVPDKSIYAGRYLPGFDAGEARRALGAALDGRLEYIDLAGALGAGDFYRTDLHWDQPKLMGGCLAALDAAMGLFGSGAPAAAGGDGAARAPFPAYAPRVAGDFLGVYAGQLALPIAPDAMAYMTGGALDEATVSYLDPQTGAMRDGPMYQLDAFGGRDPYDLFLGGAQPLIAIDNPGAPAQRELYLFRDSFSSSLAPLLVSAYSRIVLIDLRYIDSRALPQFVDYAEGSDVLFLYSSQILNNASVLH